jgi:hypothetical protein
MTDFDDDEPVEPPKQRRRPFVLTTDQALGLSGAVLAVTAAFFPWYVFFNEDKFALHLPSFVTSRKMPDWAGHSVVNPSPSSIGDSSKQLSSIPPADDIVTGTIPNADAADQGSELDGTDSQPFPASPNAFRLMHVANGRAMIADKNGIYIVGIGSSLPDLSKVAKFEEKDGQWVVVTSKDRKSVV